MSRHTAAKPTTYLGHSYDSRGEARCAELLHTLHRAGEIADWEPHPPSFVLLPRVPGQRATTTRPFIPTLHAAKYTCDFRVTRRDGTVIFLEFKGRETDVFRLRLRLFRHVYPDVALCVVTEPEALLPLVAPAPKESADAAEKNSRPRVSRVRRSTPCASQPAQPRR